jgi:two-component system phosphate regulon response regulator PhoB
VFRKMANEKILLVDDEEDILELLEYNLTKEGYQVSCAADGEQALAKVQETLPDLMVLDLMLPGIDGLEVCRTLKADPATSSIPIVMLTARIEDVDIVTGLELGADDYVTKPFSPRVMIARIRSVLRRRRVEAPMEDEILRRDILTINPARHEALVNGKAAPLSATEFGILRFLARRPGWVYSRSQIISGIRGEDYPVTDRSVDVAIVGLRRKLGEAGDLIETVRGVGYRFRE